MPIIRGPGALFGLLDGSAAVPGLSWVNDQDSGFYRIGANNLGLALGGVIEMNFAATAISPGADDGNALGTTTLEWADLFLASGAVINFANGNMTITHATGALAFAGGNLFLGDTSNVNMTQGLTLNQAGADDEILAFKSSDVAHGMTGLGETDTYALFYKTRASGGLYIRSMSVGVGQADSLRIEAVSEVIDSTRSTGAAAPAHIAASIKSGVSDATVGVNGNLLIISDRGTVRFIFDSDGDSHQDVGTAWTNFDDQDDLVLINSLAKEASIGRNVIGHEFAEWATASREMLERHKIITFNSDGHHFLNTSRHAMLLNGAIRQLGAQVKALERENAVLTAGFQAIQHQLTGGV